MAYNTIAPFLGMFLLACCISQTQTAVPTSSEVYRVNIIRWSYKVHIMNGFVDNAKPLLIRCHSNDDDLGEHTLWKDQEFRFQFRLSFIKITHFVCYLEWGSKSLSDITVFKMGEESIACGATGNCFWKAAEEGVYFSNDNQNWERWYDWK